MQLRKGGEGVNSIDPVCMREYASDCFANNDGRCSALSSTYFKGKMCPFYKSKVKLEIERAKAIVRLENLHKLKQ